MSIHILNPRIISPDCRTRELHCRYSRDFHEDGAFDALESIVKGNDVIELGCGVFGGLSKRCLDFGCASYTGVDMSIGNPAEKEHPFDARGHIIWSEEIPCIITIPENIAHDPKVNFIYGIDFVSYLESLGEENNARFVTVSTGFFHDYLLLTPNNEGIEYIRRGLRHLARITKQGEKVGLHHVMFDAYGRGHDGAPRSRGRVFKEIFEKVGISITCYERSVWYLNKP